MELVEYAAYGLSSSPAAGRSSLYSNPKNPTSPRGSANPGLPKQYANAETASPDSGMIVAATTRQIPIA